MRVISILVLLVSTLKLTVAFWDCSDSNSSYPRETTRVCRIFYNSTEQELEVGGNGGAKCKRRQSPSCDAHAGMNITIECHPESSSSSSQEEIHRVEIARNNQVLRTNSTSVMINSVNPSDSGQYECRAYFRGVAEPVIAYFNVSVSTEVAIAIYDFLCGAQYTFNSVWNCCSTDVFTLTNNHRKLVVFYAYNSNISMVEQEWITDAADHYHTDLGLYVEFFPSTGNIQINVARFPAFFNDRSLQVAAIITASHYYSNLSLSLYAKINLRPDRVTFSINESLPADTYAYEGKTAVFECQVSSLPSSCLDKHILEYTIQGNNNSNVAAILAEPFECGEQNNYSKSSDLYSLNVTLDYVNRLSKKFLYQFYIININSSHNNSVFSCSIQVDDQIQWQRNATLTVLPEIIENVRLTHPPSIVINSNYKIKILTPLAVCILTVLIIGAIIVPVVIVVKKKKVSSSQYWNNRKGNLSGFSAFSNTEENPLDPDWNQSKNHVVLNDHGPAIKEFKVMQPSCSSKDSDYLTANADYSDPGSTLSSLGTQQDHCIVYISYTNSKTHWVHDYLKPLIESWNSQVILHEEDMVPPRYIISGERQHLILGAHRVVLVMSEDYSSSPWCLYELQHAITKEPVLFKDRIIPIMVDGYHHTLPVVLKGIVALHDSDMKFEVKLKKNICGDS